jgi:GNAT superfamily N-acetyltransferase
MRFDNVPCTGIKLTVLRDREEAGHAFLYLLRNNLHQEPFGLLEDVYVEEKYRGRGIAREILLTVIDYAKNNHCYKLIATSRDDGTRDNVHAWYIRLGFNCHGKEFRINF